MKLTGKSRLAAAWNKALGKLSSEPKPQPAPKVKVENNDPLIRNELAYMQEKLDRKDQEIQSTREQLYDAQAERDALQDKLDKLEPETKDKIKKGIAQGLQQALVESGHKPLADPMDDVDLGADEPKGLARVAKAWAGVK